MNRNSWSDIPDEIMLIFQNTNTEINLLENTNYKINDKGRKAIIIKYLYNKNIQLLKKLNLLITEYKKIKENFEI
jgi:hypothetical protein